MKFYMHQRIIGENLRKIGLILSAQWRFSEERYQACPVTLTEAANEYLEALTSRPNQLRLVHINTQCMVSSFDELVLLIKVPV